ncbi:hypothetical protein B0T24DRAFT_256058 [Lasiosphaeria ovina]|uniref:Uncharacterized protein n=1 Tax=Lasiosphaeria ovina TaxID=92902 RepID=A0AAE0KAY6_9PEZI|nr:hypothetical protein B0T24DRAFT_256058 [Lasiosphaeria ovina]
MSGRFGSESCIFYRLPSTLYALLLPLANADMPPFCHNHLVPSCYPVSCRPSCCRQLLSNRHSHPISAVSSKSIQGGQRAVSRVEAVRKQIKDGLQTRGMTSPGCFNQETLDGDGIAVQIQPLARLLCRRERVVKLLETVAILIWELQADGPLTRSRVRYHDYEIGNSRCLTPTEQLADWTWFGPSRTTSHRAACAGSNPPPSFFSSDGLVAFFTSSYNGCVMYVLDARHVLFIGLYSM